MAINICGGGMGIIIAELLAALFLAVYDSLLVLLVKRLWLVFSLGNYGFYGFYGTPFSPLVLGCFRMIRKLS